MIGPAAWLRVWIAGFLLLTGGIGLSSAALGASSSVRIARLRCEYRTDPLGIDIRQPRLSWIVESDERGQKQTAYRILVASSATNLAAGRADLWDSGYVDAGDSIHVAYAGQTLSSRMTCFWKVRIRDVRGRESDWSPVASWSMGLLEREDWGAAWIAHPKTEEIAQRPPHNGYHSAFAASSSAVKWVEVDLRGPVSINGVRLYPARPFDWTPETPGFLFPTRFMIEAGQHADGSDRRIIVDRRAHDVPRPGVEPVAFDFAAITARYVRLTATQLAQRDPDHFGLALAEMEVLSDGTNRARGASVEACDAIETGAWSKARLVDGETEPRREPATMAPSTLLRRTFIVDAPVRRATLYATGLGVYELRLNGQRVGDQLLAPEWTRYTHRIQYQAYDVTSLVRTGTNAIGAMLGEGWYAGPLMLKPAMRNPVFRLLVRMEIEHADGRIDTVVTDPSWRATDEGPVRRSGIYFGETYDATREQDGWDQPGFDAQGWLPARVVDQADGARLNAAMSEPIRVTQELKPIRITEPRPGCYVFDLGQNMVGWCRLKASGPRGTRITLRHGEMLNPDGTLYIANLRTAAQINEYTLDGRGAAILEPHFTYHGFRYVEVTGLPHPPADDTLVGRVFHSSAPSSSTFESSDPLLNQLMRNILWTQRGNLMSAPTDCPQRDEREGWTGDIQAFCHTALFNMDLAAFLTKWLQDVRDSQASDGRYPDIAPHVADPDRQHSGVPAWGDAGTIVPWTMYEHYADTRLLRDHFASACRWVDFIHRNNPGHRWRQARGQDYGDWLNGDTLRLEGYPQKQSEVPKEVLATAFFAHSAELVSKMARVLGESEAAGRYAALHRDIRSAFNAAYVDSEGRIEGDTQAGYALALAFDLLDEPARQRAVGHLRAAIDRYRGHLSTGIQTTHRAMLSLSRYGQHAEACRLVGLRTVPSWGYMIERDATTIWERWDGYVSGRGFQDPGMNSFNHWAFGAVGEWMWRELAGLHPDETAPGFKHFIIRPRPGPDLTWVNSTHASIRGPIEIRWAQKPGRFTLDVAVPPGSTATVYVPARASDAVTERGSPVTRAEGVRVLRMEAESLVLQVDSGRYTFQSAPTSPPASP